MCNSLAIVWKVATAKSPCKLLCKRNNISEQFEISNRFEFTFRVSCKRALRKTIMKQKELEIKNRTKINLRSHKKRRSSYSKLYKK